MVTLESMLVTLRVAQPAGTSPATDVSRGQDGKSDAGRAVSPGHRQCQLDGRRAPAAPEVPRLPLVQPGADPATAELHGGRGGCAAERGGDRRRGGGRRQASHSVDRSGRRHRQLRAVGAAARRRGGRHDRLQQGHGGGSGPHPRAGRGGARRSARSGAEVGPAADDVSLDHAIGHDRRLHRRRLCRHRLGPSRHHSRLRNDPVGANSHHRGDPAGADALRQRRGFRVSLLGHDRDHPRGGAQAGPGRDMDRLHRDVPELWRRHRLRECRIRQRSRHLPAERRRAPVRAVLQAAERRISTAAATPCSRW